jgi:hypothetical protein
MRTMKTTCAICHKEAIVELWDEDIYLFEAVSDPEQAPPESTICDDCNMLLKKQRMASAQPQLATLDDFPE